MKADGHIHTPYCPHGSRDSLDEYIWTAIKFGFTEITFTEHAPLPPSFVDPTPEKDSGMDKKDVESYILDVQQMKQKYSNDIKINVGFEVDYITGYEGEITEFLHSYGKDIDDSILSVHFLKDHHDNYYCLDFSEEEFQRIITVFGSVEEVHKNYYETLIASIHADLGPFKPKRIGHITLSNKFILLYPCENSFEHELTQILDHMAKNKLQLDYNGAGVVKPYCNKPYPPDWVIKEAVKRDIPLIYGSDAHSAKGINQGWGALSTYNLHSPTEL